MTTASVGVDATTPSVPGIGSDWSRRASGREAGGRLDAGSGPLPSTSASDRSSSGSQSEVSQTVNSVSASTSSSCSVEGKVSTIRRPGGQPVEHQAGFHVGKRQVGLEESP